MTALLLHGLEYDFVADDAFIYARYARNWVRGYGLVFNVGERVEGYASLPWTLAIGLLGRAGDYVFAMRTLSFACASSMVPLLWWICRKRLELGITWSAAALLSFASWAPLACWTFGGLEACGYALAVLGVVAAASAPADDARATLPLVLTGIACTWMRPEGIVIVLAVALSRHRRGRGVGRLLAEVVPSALALGVLTAFRAAYYGELLPNTAFAKMSPGLAQLLRGARYTWAFFVDHGGVLVWAALLGAAFFAAARSATRTAAFATLAIMAVTSFEGGDGLPMFRFFVPACALLTLIFTDVARRAWSLLRARFSVPLPVGAGALALVWVGAVASVHDAPTTLGQHALYSTQRREEVPRWSAVGQWLAHATPPDASVACVPIGAVGYYSDRHVIDMLGLTDRHIARVPVDPAIGWTGHTKHDGAYVLRRRPTILLLGNVRVLPEPMSLEDPLFGRPLGASQRAREQDVFTPELERLYERRVAQVAPHMYLHYWQLREASGGTQR